MGGSTRREYFAPQARQWTSSADARSVAIPNVSLRPAECRALNCVPPQRAHLSEPSFCMIELILGYATLALRVGSYKRNWGVIGWTPR